ncbi:MAG: nicotinate phosphoribosyltransferase, partial [bacterium]
VCLAAEGDPVMDFGLRRAQGMDGGLSASRACYVGGCVGTSNVLAGKIFGLPVMGTHAHSWVMAFDGEREAFEAFAVAMPDNCVFLVDTYGSVGGVRNAIAVALKMREQGHQLIGVRLDSGDLAHFSKLARAMLDEAGLNDVVVMGSNELDELVIRSLKAQGAKISAWGVGTKLITAGEEPALTGVYKLAAIRGPDGDWINKIKLSEQKAKTTIPGRLQLYRYHDRAGRMAADAIMELREEPGTVRMIVDPNDNTHRKRLHGTVEPEPLLQTIVERGELVYSLPPLDAIRERTGEQLRMLDDSHKRFENPHIYPVGLSPALNKMRDGMITRERDLLASGG